MKIISILPILIQFLIGMSALDAQTTPNQFNKETDLFIAQFDSIPDPDDIMSQAAIGSLLAHPDYAGINYL